MDDLFPETLPKPPDPDSRILVGTSGYSFRDWVGPFYPPSLRPAQFLPFYANHFACVEVNATYYRIPDPSVLERMAAKTPPGFRFMVKLHQSTTHDRSLDPATLGEFRAAIEPLKASGKYDGLLAQFPFGFRRSTHNETFLDAMRDAFAGEPLFVEFRHTSWNVPELEPFLRERQLGFCAVDEPALPGLMPPVTMVTTDTAYVRFHGRNQRAWWARSEPAEKTVRESPMEPSRELELRAFGGGTGSGAGVEPGSSGDRQLLRYDYDYSAQELGEWMTRIRELADQARRTYLFFNNCHAGQAARSAKLMQDLLRQQKLTA